MDSLTWVIFDIMGTIAFAISGAMVAIHRRMDIFGIIVLASLTAVGGGMVRDVLAGITPPVALCNVTDFMLAIVTAIIV
ncbi:MAG: TRIC cation channel family protein, partial [Selenomonas sp.]|nr:TRIC cation channel family protein [Selenomonas sp.]